ncbi:uncharacterized protein P174DRAFT_495537 [Aspergillus novofumigatus IBT 16806]|uniref:Uncharacterized protein n=1 Tax=Aspergillus novofumigatus (strain IBT 16806) TaxID=1392255 RepID=A0A2I1C0L8_ASPN1|nr:uncharacterized protein P174DRAFT_495537 [Aspergillus novofumigatus IBT 16806]PKX91184.1 hypothetical protein P174DRAFT_495537 [Aspergillus novofumigatus IBT 16806]
MLEGHSSWVQSVVFLHDSKLVASASLDMMVMTWDATSGHCLQTVNAGRLARVESFDLTNLYLELYCGTIRLSLGSPVIPAEAPKFSACGISSDGIWITWDTGNLLYLPSEYHSYVLT